MRYTSYQPNQCRGLGLLLAVVGLASGFVLLGQPGNRTLPTVIAAKARSASAKENAPIPLRSEVAAPDETTQQRLSETYLKLPLSFEVNQGQTDARVKFFSRGGGYNLFLTSTEAVLSLEQHRGASEAPEGRDKASVRATNDVLRMKLVGANPRPKIEGSDQLPGKSNYFIGNNPKNWRVNVSTFARVHYHEVYPGVDLVYYGNQRQLENDFVVAPGVDPCVIALAFDGAKKITIDKDNNLLLQTGGGQVQLQRPVIYQLADGVRQGVAGNYVLKSSGDVGFEVAAYDHTRPLVIDPVLVYSTYLGGNGVDVGDAIAVDDSGNAYVTGSTASTNFPGAAPPQHGLDDVFVAKFNAAGSALLYSTYLGGSGTESGFDIAVDSGGDAYLTGKTTSANFPVMNAFKSTYSGGTAEDAFVTRLNATGSALVYSTYLAGNFGARGWGIAASSSQGYAYVTGTTSTGFPVTASAFEATNFNSGFMTKLCTNCSGASSLVYSTFLAHIGSAEGRAIAADVAGNVYVTGNLNSTTNPNASTTFATTGAFQTTFGGGSQDAFVEKFNTNLSAAASRVYATYLGGSAKDIGGSEGAGNAGKAIAIDESGNAYITGATSSTNFPLANASQGSNGGQNDAFLTKLNSSGSALIYSTYLGGTGDDFGRSVAVNVGGGAYVTGVAGPNFPTVNPLPTPLAGVGFVTKFNLTPSGTAVVYSTLLSGVSGGSFGIALDLAGNAFATGSTNASITTAFPFQPTNGGGGTDGWVSVIADPTIIGRVSDENGNPLPGATVNLNGVPTATTTTDANGGYTFGLLTSGNSYTVSVVVPGYIFSSTSVNNLLKNVRRDFGPAINSIGGQVTLGSGGLSAVTMTLSGGKSLITQTDANGSYSFNNLPAGRNYVLTPSVSGYSFEPASKSFDNLLVNQTANFVASATFQFSLGSYTASETAGSATITVQRISGASGPASVVYLTSDGTAQQRTDYTVTIGTLDFAVNETSKSFDVPIIDDLYVEGDETINVILSNPVGATLGTPNSALITITDNDTAPATTNPLDNADEQFYVREHYLDFLSRVPDPGGLGYWAAQITACGSDPACIHNKRVDVSNAFFFEQEYQQTGSYVQRLYRAAFGNNQPFPNPNTDVLNPNEEKKMPSYAVFSQDRAVVVGGGDLAQKQLNLANAFVGRPKFLIKYPASLSTASTFVDAVLATIQNDIGVNLPAERNNLITLYGSLGRGGVMYRLADDNLATNPINNRAFIDAEYNRSFVLGEYFGYLRRDPDIGGFLFWLSKVSGTLRDVPKQHSMVCSFITSAEYQQRFSAIVTHTNGECPP